MVQNSAARVLLMFQTSFTLTLLHIPSAQLQLLLNDYYYYYYNYYCYHYHCAEMIDKQGRTKRRSKLLFVPSTEGNYFNPNASIRRYKVTQVKMLYKYLCEGFIWFLVQKH